ncbi:MAG: glycosyltransferase [Thermoanaerobaculaceae bacterium]
MVTSKHRCDDSRILGLEARTLVKHGFSVAWVGPSGGARHEGEEIDFRLFDSGCGFLRRVSHLYRALKETPARVYHCHEPDALVVALLVGKPRGSKVLFDAHEFYRGYARIRAPLGLKSISSLAYYLFELVAYRLCDHLVTVSEGVAEEMARAIPARRITVVANCSGPSVLPLREPALGPASLRLIHLGTASFYHQVEAMLQAFLLVRKEVPGAEFLQVGRLPDRELAWVQSFVHEHSIGGAFRYVPRVPFENLGAYIPCGDIGLIARQADENSNKSISTKIFDYMTFGLPVVATDLEMLRRLNARYRIATLVDTTNAGAVAAAILDLYRNEPLRAQYRANALAAVAQEFSWDHMGGRLIRAYSALIG